MPKRAKPGGTPETPADDAARRDSLDVSVESISGRYIDLAERGKLDELLRLQERRRQLLDDVLVVESELSQFENPLWLLNFYARVQNRAGNFGKKLKQRADQLERRRGKWRTEIKGIEDRIARIEPLILKVPLAAVPSFDRPPAIRSGENAFVLVRDYVIKLAADQGLSDLDICKRLDLDLGLHDAAPMGMPEPWVEKFEGDWKRRYSGVSYVAAYQCPETKNRMQKMISVAKTRFRNG